MIQTEKQSIQLTKKLLDINKKIQNADLSSHLSDLKLELAEVMPSITASVAVQRIKKGSLSSLFIITSK